MSKLIGTDPNQVPSNADLGTLAYQNAHAVDSIKAKNITVGTVADADDAYALTLSRVVGGSGVLKIIGDNYLTGNPHIKFELEPTAGATIKNGMITFTGDQIKTSALQIDTSIGRDHQNGIPSLEIYHYNYPDDNTENVPALRIRNGNSSADMKHHGFLSLESLFTGSSYESPRIYFRNNANASNDKAIIGMYAAAGVEPALNIISDLIGTSENYSDISEAQIAKFGLNMAVIRNTGNGTTPMLRLHQRTTRATGLTNGIEFRDSQNETNASIMVTQSNAGNSSATMQFRVDDGDGGNGLTDPPCGLQVNTNGIQLQAQYTAYYSYATTWVSSYQTVIPNTGLSPNASYLISIDTNNQSFGNNPYYAAASFVMMTSPGTNGSGTNTGSSFAAPTATHVGNSCAWEFTITTSVGGRNGVAVRLLNGPTSFGNGTQIRVQAFKLT
jgi:hypothetical protein